MDDRFEVVVAAGDMRSTGGSAVQFRHRWTPEGVTVEASFTGAHFIHLAVAGCVLNDLYREAEALGIELEGAQVTAWGGFDATNWTSTGIGYSVEVSSRAPRERLSRLLEVVDDVAEIPKVVRAGATVERGTRTSSA